MFTWIPSRLPWRLVWQRSSRWVERRGCLHGSVCSHIAHTNCLYRGHPAEKGHLHLRRISWLRLHWTSSDDLKLFRFLLALPSLHRVTAQVTTRTAPEEKA